MTVLHWRHQNLWKENPKKNDSEHCNEDYTFSLPTEIDEMTIKSDEIKRKSRRLATSGGKFFDVPAVKVRIDKLEYSAV